MLRLSHLLPFALSCVLAGAMAAGCEAPAGGGAKPGTPNTGSKSLFSQNTSGRERWTIRALHTTAPGHEAFVQRLADELKRAPGLQANQVRVGSDMTGSTIYYGEYVKVASPSDPTRLVFPPEYQRDSQLIRRLIINQSTPFFYAEPELIDKPAEAARGAFDVANARGKFTLYVAVFYNTPGFDQRREAAEQYVKLLREAGITAYYRHEDARSYVFVGDFDDSDVVTDRNRNVHYGPRVEALINQRPQEFLHLTENGHLVRYSTPTGQMLPPQSYLVPVPREGVVTGGTIAPSGRPAAPSPFRQP